VPPSQPAAPDAAGPGDDPGSTPAGGSTPGPAPSGPTASGRAPGLRAQFAATRAAVIRLIQAHVELARAEFSEIADEVKRIAIGSGIAFGMLLFVAMLLPVGITLFLGEWLWGSMGWGVLHGTELAIAVGLTAVLAALRLPGRSIGRAILVAVIAGVVVAIVFGLNLPHEAWVNLAATVAPAMNPGYSPLVVAAFVTAAMFAILGFLIALLKRWGVGAAIRGFILGAVIGLFVGAFTAISFSVHVGIAFGIAIGLALWSVGLGVAVARNGIDMEDLKKRMTPDQTIETTKETLEWVRKLTQRGPKS